MSYRMFIDDERFPPGDENDWAICRNLFEVQLVIDYEGMPSFISFDHDLGANQPSGMDITKWLVESELDGKLKFPEGFDFYVHSQNTAGAKNIEGLLRQYLQQRTVAP